MDLSTLNPTRAASVSLLLVVTVLIWGCDQGGMKQKQDASKASKSNVETDNGQPRKAQRFSGLSKQDARKKLKKAARLLATAGPNEALFSSVKEGLALRRKQGYAEDISFAHVLKQEPKVSTRSFRSKYKPVSNSFRSEFQTSLSKAGISLSSDLRSFLVKNGITVAWLQRERFKAMPAAPTITFHPLTKVASEPNSGVTVPGFKPVQDRNDQYKRVTVDKSYIESNPTLVVRPCETGLVQSRAVNKYCEVVGPNVILPPGGGGGGGDGDPPDIDPEDDLEVELADFQCDGGDTDGPLNGGPDIRVHKGEPTASAGNVGTSETTIYIESFSDQDCDNHEWHEINTNWDGLWERMDVEQGMVIIDDDITWGSADVNMSVDPEYGPFSGTLSVESSFDLGNNDTWHEGTFARLMFTGDPQPNWENCDNGSRDGRCIQGVGDHANLTFDGILLEDNP